MALPRNYNEDYIYLQYIDGSILHLGVNEMGIDNFSHKPSLPPRMLQRYSLHFVLKGKGTYRCAEKEYHLKAGDILVIYPGTLFSLTHDPEEPWEYFWLNFNGEDAPKLLKTACFSMENPIYTIQTPKKIISMIKNIKTRDNLNCNLRLHALSLFLQIFAVLTEQRATTNISKLPSNKEFYVQSALKYIENNFQNPELRIDDICKQLSISHSHLCKLFQQQTGISIYHQLLLLRMQNAKLLLENTNEKIINVARAVGYSNVSYFCSEFRRLHGLSPTAYRCDFIKFKKDIALVNKFSQNDDSPL